jgi:hypothetical protein
VKNFLLNNYSFITHLVEIIAALTGIFLYKKYKNTSIRYFIWFLIYVAILELIGAYPRYFRNYEFLNYFETLLKDTKLERNSWWYNIFWHLGSALFYSFYFTKVLKTSFYVKTVRFAGIVFFFSSIIYIITHWHELFTFQLVFLKIFGAVIIMLCVILYFTEILQSNNVLKFYKSINFYISSIIFIWWLVITPLVFYQMYYSTADWNFVFSRRMIYLFANIFMYGSFTIALIWCKPQNV